MKVDVILGLQWGDEGKGKLVDVLSHQYDVVARFQGGPNAGHTLYVQGKKCVLHQIPSGVLSPHTENLIADGVVLDPIELQKEVLDTRQITPNIEHRLHISKGAHLILPIHKLLDQQEEKYRKDEKLGSTLKGIGPCYQDKYARRSLRVADITSPTFAQKYERIESWYNIEKTSDYIYEKEKFIQALTYLQTLSLVEGVSFVKSRLQKGQRILAEGAQGTLLDINYGTYPFVTSSHTSIGSVCIGLGIGPKDIGKIYGVSKAYCTRVGEGPFPSEEHSALSETLGEKGQEFGATTGRKRRCGWIDLPALRYAIERNNVDKLLLTKVDVLADLDSIKICTGYQLPNGRTTSVFSPHLPFEDIEVIYEELSSWPLSSMYAVQTDWPVPLQEFVDRITCELAIPIGGMSYGPSKEDTLFQETIHAG